VAAQQRAAHREAGGVTVHLSPTPANLPTLGHVSPSLAHLASKKLRLNPRTREKWLRRGASWAKPAALRGLTLQISLLGILGTFFEANGVKSPTVSRKRLLRRTASSAIGALIVCRLQ
jgi:hypothetical protein